MGHVELISQFWRLPGNSGYNASIDRIRDRLAAAGFAIQASTANGAPHLVVEEYPNQGRGWEHSVGTVAIVREGVGDDVVLSREQERLALIEKTEKHREILLKLARSDRTLELVQDPRRPGKCLLVMKTAYGWQSSSHQGVIEFNE